MTNQNSNNATLNAHVHCWHGPTPRYCCGCDDGENPAPGNVTGKADHTPLPWEIERFPMSDGRDDLLALNHVGKHFAGRNWGTHVRTADGTSVLQTDGATSEEAVANAHLIIKSVNSHAALVAALRELEDACRTRRPYGKALTQARAALAEVGQ